MRSVVQELVADQQRFPGVQGAKVASAVESPGRPGSTPVGRRNETIVIYLTDEGPTRELISQWLSENSDRIDSLLTGPKYQLPFADVLRAPSEAGAAVGSWATSPTDSVSFGTSRSDAVQTVLGNGPWPDFASFREAVYQEFEAANIDPDNPHEELLVPE